MVAVIKPFHVLEDFVFREARIFQRTLLKAVAFDQISFVLFHKPAVQPRLFVEFRAGYGAASET